MPAKIWIILGVCLVVYCALLEAPRLLEYVVRHYLKKTFPDSEAEIHITAPLFWFLSGDLSGVSLQLSHFDASIFPIPTRGASSKAGPGQGVTETTEGKGDNNGKVVIEDSSILADRLAGEALAGEPPPAESAVMAEGMGAPLGAPSQGKESSTPRRSQAPRWAQIGLVDVTLSDFQVFGRHLQSFRAELPAIRYDFALARRERKLELGGSGQGSLRIVLSESDLGQSVHLDRPEIRSLYIHTEPERLRVTLDYRSPLGWVPIAITGQLSVVEGHAIHFTNLAISAVNVPLPQMVTDMVISRLQNLNPVFDLATLHLPVELNLTSVISTEQGLVIQGQMRLPG